MTDVAVPRSEVPDLIREWADKTFHYGESGHTPWEWHGGSHVWILTKKGHSKQKKIPTWIFEELEEIE